MILPNSVSEEFLRSAKPRLITQVKLGKDKRMRVNPRISNHGYDEVYREGYDPERSALGRPIYWRVVGRGGKRFYYSTFAVRRDEVLRHWGQAGLAFCDPTTGLAVARIESEVSDDHSHQDYEQALGLSREDIASVEAGAKWRHQHAHYNITSVEDASEDCLSVVVPRLIITADFTRDAEGRVGVVINSEIRQTENQTAGAQFGSEVREEGYTSYKEYPELCPLRRSVYWRIVKGSGDELVCSTFVRDEVQRLWGDEGVALCDPATGFVVARVEAKTPSDPEIVKMFTAGLTGLGAAAEVALRKFLS